MYLPSALCLVRRATSKECGVQLWEIVPKNIERCVFQPFAQLRRTGRSVLFEGHPQNTFGVTQTASFQRRLFFADGPAQFGKFQSKRAPIYIAQALGNVINRNRAFLGQRMFELLPNFGLGTNPLISSLALTLRNA